MSIKLVINSRSDIAGTKSWERCFDQNAITIGRTASNDLTLQDPQRVVSSRHAEIRRKANDCVIVDAGSTNGTRINDQRLVPGKEYPLHEGDRIRIGEFILRFHQSDSSDNGTMPASVLNERLASSVEEFDYRGALAYKVRRLYADITQRDPKEREEALFKTLREGVRALDARRGEQVLKDIKSSFSSVGAESHRPACVSTSGPSQPALEIDAANAAYQGCLAIATRYCKDLGLAVSPDFVNMIMQRIDSVLLVTITGLTEAIRGRKQIAREFDVEVTRILSWAPNQIKLAEGEQEIGRYLLDPREEGVGREKAVADLEQVFRDLALHQIGLVAGFQECLRGILKEFDPSTIENEARAKLLHLVPVRLPSWFRLIPGWVKWRQFREKHRKFSEEEVKVFEKILAPHFEKGYLSVHKTKSQR